jgi:hypothetical protein
MSILPLSDHYIGTNVIGQTSKTGVDLHAPERERLDV